MIQYVKNYFEANDKNATDLPTRYPFRDRFEHSMRVYKWAQRINRLEKGDKAIVEIAAIFHDVGKAVDSDLPHAEISAEICDRYLREINFPDAKRQRVVKAVRLHSSKLAKGAHLMQEDKILIDADLLDEAGALAVLWDSMATALESDPSYMKAYERHLEYYEELKKQKKFLKTKTGKKLFTARLAFLKEYIANLKYELGI